MNGDADPTAAYRAWAAADLRAQGVTPLVVGAATAVSKKTWLLPGRRERGVALLRGCPADRLDAARPYRVVPAGSSPAGRALVGVGLGLAGEPALVFLGTGSAAYGELHAALHLLATHRPPVQLVLSWYAGEGPFAAPLAVAPVALAQALGLGAVEVDGSDEAAVRAAVAAGTTVVVARLSGRA